jgi:hypothetical protein
MSYLTLELNGWVRRGMTWLDKGQQLVTGYCRPIIQLYKIAGEELFQEG